MKFFKSNSRSTWFTGGYYVNDAIVWDTNDVIDDVNTYWNEPPQSGSGLYNRLAYKLGGERKKILYSIFYLKFLIFTMPNFLNGTIHLTFLDLSIIVLGISR